ncbi:Bug family tripartite tricarboxylate transporter substrate binding protein [Verticiella sediminum]|uniref:Bug family tripartite tricarboxylate transporter substrate binding protein n=1 Tax=Verticiella sediminum TaxID=1247510 RepID=UPI001FED1F29|nr:tripartite tricarboxylate transporter substrate binding protein [Verticiella sediminum]
MSQLAAALVLTAIGTGAVASAPAAYPSKPVRLVVAYPPGGTTDTQARILAQKLSERWRQTIIVDNRPGGNTVIATAAVASAEPDGHTLLLTAMPVALNPLVMDSLPYDTKKDLAPVTLLTTVPGVVITNTEQGVKSLPEFVEKYKNGKAPALFGSAGNLTFTHLSGELFANRSGLKLEHVPYKGSAGAHQDLIGGRVDILFDNGALPLIQAGRVVPLGVTSRTRLPWLPEVPTVAEQGFPDYEAAAWFGIFTRGGTPKPVVEQIAKDISWALNLPEVQQQFAAAGVFAEGGTPEDFQRHLDAETERWARIIREQNITLQ